MPKRAHTPINPKRKWQHFIDPILRGEQKVEDKILSANTSVNTKEERNMGVELFRVVSMMLVVMLHVLGHGGVYSHTDFLSDNYKVAWFLETAAYCSVNCYALISGFANVRSNFKFRRIILLWLEVFTLNVGMTVFMSLFVPSVELTSLQWRRALMPLLTSEFWYFCSYTLMFPLLPILNKGILSLKKYQHIIIMFFLMSPTIIKLISSSMGERFRFELASGYSTMWLISLYVVGAYFRIYGAPKWAKWFVTLPTFILSTLIALMYKLNIEEKYEAGIIEKDSAIYSGRGILISYISPCMVIASIALLLFFMQIKIKHKVPKLIISNLGKATFGVFILHVGQFWLWTDFWKYFNAFADMPTWKMVLWVFIAVIAIYLGFSLISVARIYLFKLLRINKAVDYIAELPSRLKEKRK